MILLCSDWMASYYICLYAGYTQTCIKRQDKKNMTALAGSTICLRKTEDSCLLRRDL